MTYFYKEVTTPVVEKPSTPSVPEKPVQKLRLPKGNNGAKTRVPVKKEAQFFLLITYKSIEKTLVNSTKVILFYFSINLCKRRTASFRVSRSVA